MSELADVGRASSATDSEHVAARDTERCPICGAAPGVECTYGAYVGRPAGMHFPGRVHLRRVRVYLARPGS